MRGYAPTTAAPDGRYQSVLLAQDAVALIMALGAERARLVGHDWGAQATYGAAALAPERIERMVTLAAAHPGAARGDLALSYDRLKGTWHAYFFQMPFAEQAVAANDFLFLERWWRDAAPEYVPPPEIMESVKSTFRQPGVVTAALSYYRHTFHPAHRDSFATLQEQVNTVPTPVPTSPSTAPKIAPDAWKPSKLWTTSSPRGWKKSFSPAPAISRIWNTPRRSTSVL
jgi:pimeloyl-ACP methyl ester carboxylesterase